VRILSGVVSVRGEGVGEEVIEKGNVYGTTYTGGVGTVSGVVFELKAK